MPTTARKNTAPSSAKRKGIKTQVVKRVHIGAVKFHPAKGKKPASTDTGRVTPEQLHEAGRILSLAKKQKGVGESSGFFKAGAGLPLQKKDVPSMPEDQKALFKHAKFNVRITPQSGFIQPQNMPDRYVQFTDASGKDWNIDTRGEISDEAMSAYREWLKTPEGMEKQYETVKKGRMGMVSTSSSPSASKTAADKDAGATYEKITGATFDLSNEEQLKHYDEIRKTRKLTEDERREQLVALNTVKAWKAVGGRRAGRADSEKRFQQEFQKLDDAEIEYERQHGKVRDPFDRTELPVTDARWMPQGISAEAWDSARTGMKSAMGGRGVPVAPPPLPATAKEGSSPSGSGADMAKKPATPQAGGFGNLYRTGVPASATLSTGMLAKIAGWIGRMPAMLPKRSLSNLAAHELKKMVVGAVAGTDRKMEIRRRFEDLKAVSTIDRKTGQVFKPMIRMAKRTADVEGAKTARPTVTWQRSKSGAEYRMTSSGKKIYKSKLNQ